MMLDADLVAVNPAKSNVGTNPSKGSAFGPGRRCRSNMRGVWWRVNVEHYNNVRLNSAIGYITPQDMLVGHQQEVQAERDRKLQAAREQRKNRRQQAA